MTHFSVLVIGPDVDKQLAPFDEGLRVEPYKSHLDDQSIERMRAWLHGEKGLGASPAEIPDDAILQHIPEWTGCTEGLSPGKDEAGFYTWTTFNPQHKWDWYEVGGRWRGRFLLKPGACGILGDPGVPEMMALREGEASLQQIRVKYAGRADSALKRDIDFAATARRARRQAQRAYDLLEEVTRGLRPPKQSFRGMLKRRMKRARITGLPPQELVVQVRAAYSRHRWVQAIEAHDRQEMAKTSADRAYEPRLVGGFFDDPVETYLVNRGGRKAYLKAAALDACFGFVAVVDHGQWLGSWSYFGPFAYNQDEDPNFPRATKKRVLALPDDTRLTVVDCHT